MLKVGLTGGYASGKSFVAKHLESLGCHVIYADRLGHQVLMPDGEAYHPTLSLFTHAILAPDQTIDRKKLAAIVFENPELLARLNSIVHPAVFRLEEQSLLAFERQNPGGIAVIEAAILIETERHKELDRLIVTICDPETQIQRAIARDHITRQQAQTRLARQLSNPERVRFANHVIDTSGTPEQTTEQTDHIHQLLQKSGQYPHSPL